MVAKSRIEKLCQNISRNQANLSYGQIEKRLENVGFKLAEYGGECHSYAQFVHQTGIIATVEYGWIKDRRNPRHEVPGRITDFHWNDDPEYVKNYFEEMVDRFIFDMI